MSESLSGLALLRENIARDGFNAPSSVTTLKSVETTSGKSGGVRPYSILVFSDVHFPLPQSDAAHLYEMLVHVYDHGGADVIVRNGDWFDGWEAKGRELTPMQKSVIDLLNRMQEDFGTKILDTEGNHNDLQMDADIAHKASDAGLLVAPGVRIHTPLETAIVVHGHQFDSKIVQQDILEEADNEYRRLSKNGDKRDTDMASNTKRETKKLLSALGYDQSYAYAAHKYDVNRVIIGHRHLPENRIIGPYGPLQNALDSYQKRKETKQSINDIGRNFMREWQASATNASRRLGLQFIAAHGKTIVHTLSQERVNEGARSVANVLSKMGYYKFSDLMDLVDSKPNVDLLDRISIKALRPSYFQEGKISQKESPRYLSLTDAGSWIDGNASFVAYDSKGSCKLIDWYKERIEQGYTQKLEEPTLCAAHEERFGAPLFQTHREIRHYKNDVTGYLDREKRQEEYQLPAVHDMAQIEMDHAGRVRLAMPVQMQEQKLKRKKGKDHDPEALVIV